MKFLKVLGGIIVVLVVLIIIGGFVLPSEQSVSRSTVIDADQAEIFALVSDYREFNRWSPWAARDPETKYTYGGPDAAVGSTLSWDSEDPNVGRGQQEIVAMEQGTMVRNKLTFDGFDQASYATMTLEPAGNGTRVTWEFEANLDSFLGRYMGLMMDDWVGADYEDGLARLKAVVESDS